MALFVADLMTPSPAAVPPEADAALVTDIMRRLRVRHVPVVDEQGAVVGIISDRDVLRVAHEPGRARSADAAVLRGLRARDLMSYVVMSVAPDTLVADAGRRMLDARVSCLPVVQDGRLVGILTEADFVHALSRDEDA